MKSSQGLLFILLWLFSQLALGHAMGSSFLHLTEVSSGVFSQHWVPARQLKRLAVPVEPQYPSHCSRQGVVVDCGQSGLIGDIRFTNLPLHADVVVRIEWLNGGEYTHSVAGQSQSVHITAAENGASSRIQVLTTYIEIGIEHILLGIDHLLFVAGLLLLVGFKRQLFWTITAFTLAHSLTLVLSVSQVISVSQTAVEIIIALSILLVAAESLDRRITLARRYPWLVAFIFGLVHGLGFAGALREVGLPEHELPLSLIAFNLGVEFGQLGVILGLYIIYLLIKQLQGNNQLMRPATFVSAYVIGSSGAYWTLSRSAQLISSL
jgi:hydrogenase/urease accessory protein HupE